MQMRPCDVVFTPMCITIAIIHPMTPTATGITTTLTVLVPVFTWDTTGGIRAMACHLDGDILIMGATHTTTATTDSDTHTDMDTVMVTDMVIIGADTIMVSGMDIILETDTITTATTIIQPTTAIATQAWVVVRAVAGVPALASAMNQQLKAVELKHHVPPRELQLPAELQIPDAQALRPPAVPIIMDV